MFDTHSHLSDRRFLKDIKQTIERAKEAGVSNILTVCSDIEEINNFYQILQEYSFIYGAAGIHPHNAKNFEKN